MDHACEAEQVTKAIIFEVMAVDEERAGAQERTVMKEDSPGARLRPL